jgi:hypothetical protein
VGHCTVNLCGVRSRAEREKKMRYRHEICRISKQNIEPTQHKPPCTSCELSLLVYFRFCTFHYMELVYTQRIRSAPTHYSEDLLAVAIKTCFLGRSRSLLAAGSNPMWSHRFPLRIRADTTGACALGNHRNHRNRLTIGGPELRCVPNVFATPMLQMCLRMC